MANTLSAVVQKEVASNVQHPIQYLEINTGSPFDSVLRVSTEKLDWKGDSYDDLLIKVGKRSGGTFNIGEGIPSQHTFSFSLADPTGVYSRTPSTTFLGKNVVLHESFVGINESVDFTFIIRKVSQKSDGSLAFSCTDIFSIQDLPTIPSLTLQASVFPRMAQGLENTLVPVLFGRKRVECTLLDVGSAHPTITTSSSIKPRFLVTAGGATIHQFWNRDDLLTEDSTTSAGYEVVYLDDVGNTTTEALASYTCVDMNYFAMIYAADASYAQFIADAERTNSFHAWGTSANTPTNVYGDFYSSTLYGLQQSSANLDTTTFNAATTSLESSNIVFNTLIRDAFDFNNLFGNLLFSSHAWTTVNDKIYFYHNPTTEHTSAITKDSILIKSNKPGITRNTRDLSRVYNDLVLEYEEKDFWGIETGAAPGPQTTQTTANVLTGAGGQNTVGLHALSTHDSPKKSLFIGDFDTAATIAQLNIQELANAIYDTTITIGQEGKAYTPLDLVPVIYQDFNWTGSGQLVRITSIENNISTYTLKGYTQETKVLNADSQPVTTPSPDIVNQDPSAPTNFTGSYLYRTQTDGSVTVIAKLTWTATAHPMLDRYEIRVRNTDTSEDRFYTVKAPATTLSIEGIDQNGADTYYIKAITSNGLVSIEQSLTLASPAFGGSPTTTNSYNIEYGIDGIDITWNVNGEISKSTFPDFDHYTVELGSPTYTVMHEGKNNNWHPSYQQLSTFGVDPRSSTLLIYTWDTWGNKDSSSLSIPLVNDFPLAPTTFSATPLFTTVKLDSDSIPTSSPDDIVRREFWYKKSTDSTYTKFDEGYKTSTIFSGEESTDYNFKCIDVDFLSTVLHDEYSISSANWSTPDTSATTLGVSAPDLSNVGTLNLVRNGGFENWTGSTLDHWLLIGSSNSQITGTKSGTYALKAAYPSNGASSVSYLITGSDSGVTIDDIKGEELTLSFWYKKSSSNGSNSAKWLITDGGSKTVSGNLTPTATWQYFSQVINTSNYPVWDTSWTAAYLRFIPNLLVSSTEYAIDLDNVQIQEGNQPTAFIPHTTDILKGGTSVVSQLVDEAQINSSAYIANAVVIGSHVVTDTLSAANISPGTLTSAEIAVATIVGDNIVGGTITGGLIAADTVSAAHIATNTITANEIASNTILADNIVGGTITGVKIATDTLTATNMVKTSNILTASAQIANAIVYNAHIHDLSVDKLNAGTLDASVVNIGGMSDGATIDSTGIHLGTNTQIDFSKVNGSTKPSNNADVTASSPQSLDWISENSAVSGTVYTGGWYRIASNNGSRAYADFILRNTESSRHNTIEFSAGINYNNISNINFTLLAYSVYNTQVFTRARFLTNTTYDTQYLEVYCANPLGTTNGFKYWILNNIQSTGWDSINWAAGSIPTGYTSTEFNISKNDVVESNPSYITSTYIDATEIKSPNISSNSGQISGTLSIGTMSSSTGITISSAGIYHSNADDFTGGNANSQFGIRASDGTAYFKGDISGASGAFSGSLSAAGKVTIDGSAGKVNIDGSSSTNLFRVRSSPSAYEIISISRSTVDINWDQSFSNGLRVKGSSGAPTLHLYNSAIVALGGNAAVDAETATPNGIGIYARGYGSGGIGAKLNGLSIGVEIQKGATSSPHIRFSGAIRTVDPNGVITGTVGDLMLWWYPGGARPVLSLCYGDRTGPTSTGTSWGPSY